MKQDYRWLLMDLDGTLTDPAEGITRSVEHALDSFGIEVADRRELYPFIGPPLKNSFMHFYGMSDADGERAVAKYREYYHDRGIFENELYPGMEAFLARAAGQGRRIVMATSKPTVYARRIAEHFGIAPYFTAICGSELDGRRTDKAEVIAHALSGIWKSERRTAGHPAERDEPDLPCIIRPSEAVMIGDRKFDIAGAQANGLESVGVLYGYGTREELLAAGPDFLVSSVWELGELLLG